MLLRNYGKVQINDKKLLKPRKVSVEKQKFIIMAKEKYIIEEFLDTSKIIFKNLFYM